MKLNKYIAVSILCGSTFFGACNCTKSNDTISDEIPVTPSVTGDVYVLSTTTNLSRNLNEEYIEFSKKDNMSPTRIDLNPTVRYQEMDGFGAAITGSACYNLLKMQTSDRLDFLNKTFSTDKGYGYSYIRIAIGCSDFSLEEYTCCDKKGIENFALQSEELDLVIPVLKEILTINPDIKILASPWTAPKWMKINNLNDKKPHDSWKGGHLNPDYYQDYATYFVKWIRAFENQGIAIDAITLQNEPLNPGNSASMYMGWKEQRDFIKNAVGPTFKTEGIDAKIYAFDHNYDYDNISEEQGYPMRIYEDAEASKYIAGAAYHNYGGDKKELLNVAAAYPNKELIFTETSIGTWNDGQNLESRLLNDMEEVALGTVNNWCKGVIVWNLMLDSNKGPNRPDGGCQTCYGAVDISVSDYKTINYNSHYYIISHLSSVVLPGSVRLGTTGYQEKGITYAAFENPDNTYSLVMSNNLSEKKKITFSSGTRHFVYEVPAKSVVSFKWDK